MHNNANITKGKNITNKVCVVTGGGSGIGKAVAQMLPKDCTVIITGRNEEKLQKTADELNKEGCHIVVRACDVSKRSDVTSLAEYAKSLGEVKIVVNAAGISGSMESSEKIYRINALGTVYVNQEFYKVMDKGSVICNVASNSAYMLPSFLTPKEKKYLLAITDEEAFIKAMVKKAHLTKKEEINASVAYLISKNFARWYSSKCAFKYMYNKGIRVFSVSPGFVKTPMTVKEDSPVSQHLLKYSGTQRGAEPQELGYVIASLCDEKAGYLMGVDLLVDGGCITSGYSFLKARKLDECPSPEGNW